METEVLHKHGVRNYRMVSCLLWYLLIIASPCIRCAQLQEGCAWPTLLIHSLCTCGSKALDSSHRSDHNSLTFSSCVTGACQAVIRLRAVRDLTWGAVGAEGMILMI